MGKVNVELAVEVTDELFIGLQGLAQDRFGEIREETLSRLVAEALNWWADPTRSTEESSGEDEEPAASWDRSTEETGPETKGLILAWLFRRDKGHE